MKTIITHFYNEEYLLPWWLEHHKKYFDHGILIDYASTDNSVNIIKEICPNWQILSSTHENFGYYTNDREVEFIERQLTGWRIALTVTEFLVGDIEKVTQHSDEDVQHYIPLLIFSEYSPDKQLDKSKKLWEQCKTAISYTHNDIAKLSRSLHNFNYINYQPGRHFYGYSTEDVVIFKFASCLIGQEMIKRRLQIQHRVSNDDRLAGLAEQHLYQKGGGLTFETIKKYHEEVILPQNPIDCSELIAKLTLNQ